MGLEGAASGCTTFPFGMLKASNAIPEHVLRPMDHQCFWPSRSCFRFEMSMVENGPLDKAGFSNKDVFPWKKVPFTFLNKIQQLKLEFLKFRKV